MEALNTYTKEMTLRERVTEILSEMKMTKAELAMKIRYSRSAVSQYLGNKYSSDPTEIESRLMDFVLVRKIWHLESLLQNQATVKRTR